MVAPGPDPQIGLAEEKKPGPVSLGLGYVAGAIWLGLIAGVYAPILIAGGVIKALGEALMLCAYALELGLAWCGEWIARRLP